MPTIAIDDTTLHYERTGRGPAMLFVHGMCGDADVWADQARRLSDRSSCVSYDRRGHSRSGRGARPISAARHADDAAELIEALGLAPCLLVGSSGGAAIGIDVLVRHGHLLQGAVLSEPPLFSLDPAAGEVITGELTPVLQQASAADDPGAAAVDAFFSMICPGLWSILDEERKDHYRANAEIGLTDLRSPPLALAAEDLAAVSIPVLVLAGDRSHPSLRSLARQVAAAVPDARFVELAGSGHVTYAERPDGFAGAVRTFADELDRHGAPAR
jgi:pimeloyl-ACP methyl ester carboxylesterase